MVNFKFDLKFKRNNKTNARNQKEYFLKNGQFRYLKFQFSLETMGMIVTLLY